MASGTPDNAQEPRQTVPEKRSLAPGTRRINVVLTQQQYETLEKLANMQQITLSDALRQALNIGDLVVSANADPDTKILLQKGDKTQELKIVR